MLGIADTTHDAAVGLAAHTAVGIMAFYAGEFDAALAHVEQGTRLYDPGQHSPNRSATFRAGQDPGVSCAVYAAWTLQLLGHPARAATRMREALALARSLDHPFSVVYACHFAAGFHLCRREREAVQELEDEALAYSTEHGFRLFPMMGAIHRGWLLSEQARGEEALAQMREGLAALRAIGHRAPKAGISGPGGRGVREDQPARRGTRGGGRSTGRGGHTGQRYWDAELHRLQGTLTRQSDAEPCFLEAIRIAQRQRAKSLELRAATSLSRLWANTGKVGEAHALLSAIYDGFTEGFDTADLSDAKSLLEQLERRARTAPADGT